MKENLRVAVCQLTCHPAIYTGQQMWLEEPFIPENRTHTLSYLSVQGFKVDHLLEKCKEIYVSWHADRLAGILEFLKTLNPIPSFIIFPEGSIPYQCLRLIHAFCSETKATVFAGTHSFQRLKDLRQTYNAIGVKERTIEKLHKKSAEINGIAPIFVHDKVYIVPKKIFSPFESTDISPSEIASERFVPFNIPLGDKKTTVLPLICAEALNFTKLKIKGDYAICAILSYDKTPAHFRALMDMLVSNKKTVVYCNDGRFGGSAVLLPVDQRRSTWWYDSSFKGQLPKGDGILIADIDLRNIAVEIGVTYPTKNFNLVKLCSVTYSKDPACSFMSEELGRIKGIEEPFSKTKAIKEALQANRANEIQEQRLRFLQQLAAAGKDSEDWWIAIGCDCILNLPSLEQLEAELSKYCYEQLFKEILEHDKGTPGVEELREFLRQAKLLADHVKENGITVGPERKEIKSIINREEDVKDTLSFLDNQRQKIAQISGLQEIGKSSVVEKAFAQCRYSRVSEVEISESSSAEYLVYRILPNVFQNEEKNIQASKDILANLTESDFLAAFNRTDIVWVHKAENLLQHQNWKNQDIASVIKMIIMAAKRSDIKIIFESRRELPLEIDDSTIYFRKRIVGLERALKAHGVSYFDYQLRRVGISPSEIDSPTKEKIVERMGGHPVALALCADAIYDEGISSVMSVLREKKGFYLTFIRTLLRDITLNGEERTILNLLSTCRISVPREAILGTFHDPVAPYLRNLIHLCLVEVDSNSNIRLPGLLASYFDVEEVPLDLRNKFHRMCAECYKKLFINNKARVEYAVEADYHGALGGIQLELSGMLTDSPMAFAQKKYDTQDYKTAKKILDTLVSKKASNDILRLSALVDAKCNVFDSALHKAKSVFKANPRDTWLLSEIARAALSQGRDDIAEELIEIARIANMEDTSILIVSGRMLLRRDELRGAEEKFAGAVKVTTSNPWPYLYLGKTYLRQGEVEKAIDVLYAGEEFIYKNEIRNMKALTAIRTQLGIAYIFFERIDLAEPILTPLFQDQNEDPEVMRAYALMSLKKEGVQKAHEAYAKLREAKIRSRYDRSQYHLFYGLFYLGVGEKGKASEEFSKAHKEDKNNVYVMMKLAKTYFEMAVNSWIDGDVDIAKTYSNDCAIMVKKILEFDTDNPVGRDLQIELYDKFGLELSKIEAWH